MGLMTEWSVLLLDEVSSARFKLSEINVPSGFCTRAECIQVTVDLDVLVRSDLIDFLISESETRRATIVCTSILESLHSSRRDDMALTLQMPHIFSMD